MFPILPFVAGAAVGAVATIFLKKNTPKAVDQVGKKLSGVSTKVGEKLERVGRKIKDKTADGLEKLESQSAKVRQKLKTTDAKTDEVEE